MASTANANSYTLARARWVQKLIVKLESPTTTRLRAREGWCSYTTQVKAYTKACTSALFTVGYCLPYHYALAIYNVH